MMEMDQNNFSQYYLQIVHLESIIERGMVIVLPTSLQLFFVQVLNLINLGIDLYCLNKKGKDAKSFVSNFFGSEKCFELD